MGGRCLRVEEAFLALVDTKGPGLAAKLPHAPTSMRNRVARRKTMPRIVCFQRSVPNDSSEASPGAPNDRPRSGAVADAAEARRPDAAARHGR
jgi:hypothetical protein